MINEQLSSDVLLRRARNELLMQLPFYANLLFNMRIRKATSENELPVPTAAVDRWGNLVYCEDFIKSLNQGQVMFVLAHEASHVGLMHIGRLKNRIPDLWNIATDLEINYMLLQETRLIPPPDGLLPKDGTYKLPSGAVIYVAGKTSEEIYDQLNNILDKKCVIQMDKDWVSEYSSSQSLEQNDSNDGKNKSSSNSKNKGSHGKSKGFDKHIYGDQLGGQKASGCDPKQYDTAEDFWKEKLISAKDTAKSRGININDCLRSKLDIILEPPQIDWRHRIKIFITQGIPTDFTMKCPGRRGRSLNLYVPTTVREHVKFVIGFDCSGSIGDGEMLSFISECYSMTKFFPSCELIIVPWNGAVMEDYVVEIKQQPTTEQLQKLTEFPGGGTTLQSFIDWCDAHCSTMDNIIIFTDGYVEDKKFKLQRRQSVLVVISNHGTDDILRNSFECVKLENNNHGRK